MILRRPLWLLDARAVVRDVREQDRKEWIEGATEAGFEPNLTQLIAGCIRQSVVGGTIVEDGRPLCLWGASQARPGVGIAWLIGTNRGQVLASRIQRHFAAAIREMHAVFPTLEAHAFEENELHHYWMERLGFRRAGPSPAFASGRFILFERDTQPQCA